MYNHLLQVELGGGFTLERITEKNNTKEYTLT